MRYVQMASAKEVDEIGALVDEAMRVLDTFSKVPDALWQVAVARAPPPPHFGSRHRPNRLP